MRARPVIVVFAVSNFGLSTAFFSFQPLYIFLIFPLTKQSRKVHKVRAEEEEEEEGGEQIKEVLIMDSK